MRKNKFHHQATTSIEKQGSINYILSKNMLNIQKHRVLALTYIEICDIRLPKSLGVLELWGKGLVLIVARDWVFDDVVLVALVVIVVVGIGVEDCSSTVSVRLIMLSIMQFNKDGIISSDFTRWFLHNIFAELPMLHMLMYD